MKYLLAPALLALITHCGSDRSKKDDDTARPAPTATEDAAVAAPITPSAGDTNTPLADVPTDASADEGDMVVTIQFQPMVGDAPLACFDHGKKMLEQGQIFTDARMFLSQLSFTDELGHKAALNLDVASNSSNLQYVDSHQNSIALLNFLEPSCASTDATATVKTSITGRLPRKKFQKLQFQLGLPYPGSAPELALMPAAMAPSDMGWMWRHSPADVQIEMNTGAAHNEEYKIINILTSAHTPTIALPLAMEPQNTWLINVKADFGQLIKTSPLAFVTGLEKDCNNSSKALTASAPNCVHAYQALGLPVAGAESPQEQSVFSIVK